MNRRCERIIKTVLWGCLFLLVPLASRAAMPESGGLFNRAPETDWALGWLQALFRGANLPHGLADGAIHLPTLAAALREALSVYSLGMLVLAGFLLAYHVVAMVAETAQTGIPFGRRTNMFWTPIRLVLAISLLVPIGGGLNAGQYLVVKLAEAGSSLASNAWRGAVDTMKGSLDSFVPPHGPDAARLTMVATEMELCRSLYRQIFAAHMSDTTVARAGNIIELQKIPAGRLAPETWRYTNALQASWPLCGEYRFLSNTSAAASGAGLDETGQYPSELAAFARADAERLSLQTRPLADQIAPVFLTASSGAATPAVDISGNLAAMIQEQQKTLDAKLRAMAAGKTPLVDQALDESAAAGWIAAGFFVGNIARRQSVFGELAAQAISSAHAPLFGHSAMNHAALQEAIAADPVLRASSPAQADKVFALYDQMGSAMKQARGWLYGKALPESDLVLTDTLDVRDLTGPGNDADTASFMFTRLLKSAAATYGVWSESPRTSATERPFASFMQNMAANPIAGLAELGRRYAALGHYLLATTGPGLVEPNTLGSALLVAFIGLLFSAAGMAMMFALPLLPFFRFFLGVLAWLLAVFEAVAALPLVALAHLTPAGEGLSGPIARRAYWLWLGVFMRPLLTLFGFMVGFALLTFSLTFLNALFGPLVAPLSSAPGDGLITVWAGLALLYAVLAIAMTNAAFKSISWLPERILLWIGGWGTQETSGADSATHSASATISASNAALLAASPAVVSASISGTGAYDETQGSAPAPRSSHGLKAALIPTYREPPGQPVVIGDEGSTVAGASTGSISDGAGSHGQGASASAGATGGGTATATASATAIAMARQMPLPKKPTPADIEKALDKLAQKIDKRAPAPKENKALPPSKAAQDGAEESPEQSSAPPEDDKPA